MPTVYIPHLRGVDRLRQTLTALRDQEAPHRTILIDNASEDGSREMVNAEFPEVGVFALGENLGFGKALNAAVRSCGGDPIVFLNDDIRCGSRFLTSILSGLEPEIDMVAGVLVQDDRPTHVDSAGVVAEKDTLMGFDHLHGAPVEALEEAEPPLGPTGAAALYRRGAFEAVGGYDANIFAYLEDLDLALRMRAAGFRCALAKDAKAIHLVSATLGGRSRAKFRMTGWSRGYLLRRYRVMRNPYRAAQVLMSEAFICIGQMLRYGTTAGLTGRIRGWTAAKSLQPRRRPDGLPPIPLAERIRLRAIRRR